MSQILPILIGLIISFSLFIFLVQHSFHSQEIEYSDRNHWKNEYNSLLTLIYQHNETINKLISKNDLNSKSTDEIIDFIAAKDMEIKRLNNVILEQKQLLDKQSNDIKRLSDLSQQLSSKQINQKQISENMNNLSLIPLPLTNMEDMCDQRYGHGLLNGWKKSKQIWCDSNDHSSNIVCYPYLQEHKKLDGRGEDMFCEATNLYIDFTKVYV